MINNEYKDCVVIVNDTQEDMNFIWKNKRCFSIQSSLINDFLESTLGFFNGNVIRVASALQLASENSILVKSSSIYPVVIIAFCFITLIAFGMYVWLL